MFYNCLTNEKAYLVNTVGIVVKHTVSKGVTDSPVNNSTTKTVQSIFDQNINNILFIG